MHICCGYMSYVALPAVFGAESLSESGQSGMMLLSCPRLCGNITNRIWEVFP